jgi:hypothetical protein
MTNYILPSDFKAQLEDYLSQRPWREVEGAMHILLALKPIPAIQHQAEDEKPIPS